MHTNQKPLKPATFLCCRRCGSLHTLAQPCPCRTQEDLPGPAMAVWPLCVIALLCVVILFLLIGWQPFV